MKEFKIGGWVRIMKNGSYNSSPYKIGELWQITGNYSSKIVDVERREKDGSVLKTRVAHDEYEWIGEGYEWI
jgi:hypothetical protein